MSHDRKSCSFPACASGPAKTHKDRANKKVYTHSLRLLEDFHALCNLIDYSNSNDPDSSVMRFPGGGGEREREGTPILDFTGIIVVILGVKIAVLVILGIWGKR